MSDRKHHLTDSPSPALDAGDSPPATALWHRLRALDAPTSLRELGARPEDLPRVVDQAMDAPYSNPREVNRDALTALLDAAFHGRPPREDDAHA